MKGVNPLPNYSWHDDMISHDATLHWLYTMKKNNFELPDGTKITGLNFNPYITDKNGNKNYYQRDLCWNLEDKQNLIESIYHELNCGFAIIKINDEKKLKETLCEYDVVDGKQRIHTLFEFFDNEFCDKNGYYWSDFNLVAKRLFLNRKFPYYEIRENASDDKIKRAFLNVNFTGVPMNKEHIEFVKSINI